jgi:hypothetical protein
MRQCMNKLKMETLEEIHTEIQNKVNLWTYIIDKFLKDKEFLANTKPPNASPLQPSPLNTTTPQPSPLGVAIMKPIML